MSASESLSVITAQLTPDRSAAELGNAVHNTVHDNTYSTILLSNFLMDFFVET